MRELTRISGSVGFAKTSQKPRATPAKAACETVSLKKAIRRAVTKTPRSEQSGARKSAARKARCMNGSVSMAIVSVVVMVGGNVYAVGLFQRIGIHDLIGRSFAANHTVQGIDPGGLLIDHR